MRGECQKLELINFQRPSSLSVVEKRKSNLINKLTLPHNIPHEKEKRILG